MGTPAASPAEIPAGVPADAAADAPADTVPVYVISVAAQLTGLHPQTLRQYDRLGLVSPGRSSGRGRRYSARDLAQLRVVQQLTAEGVNLAGVKRILELEDRMAELAHRVERLETLSGQMSSGQPAGSAPAGPTHNRSEPGSVQVGGSSSRRRYLPVPVYSASTALVLWRPRRRR